MTTPTILTFQLKTLVQGAYDMQKLRISIGNRICQQYRHRMGIVESQDEQKMASENKKILEDIRKEYKLLADGLIDNDDIININAILSTNKCISNFSELQLITEYMNILSSEIAAFNNIKPIVHQSPLWNLYLKGIRGIGETLAAVILSKFDIHKATYVTSLWKYAGLDEVEQGADGRYDGRGRGRYKNHLVPKDYENRDGKITSTIGISYHPWLKSKLLGTAYECLIRQNSHYREIRSNYAKRLENDPKRQCKIVRRTNGDLCRIDKHGDVYEYDQRISCYFIDKFHEDKSLMEIEEFPKSRRINMCRRYVIKQFLKDLYEAWKQIENLPRIQPYDVRKLGAEKHTEVRLHPDGTYHIYDLRKSKYVEFNVKLEDNLTITDIGKQPKDKVKKRGRKTTGQKISTTVKQKANRKVVDSVGML